jgi:hypothetical protein
VEIFLGTSANCTSISANRSSNTQQSSCERAQSLFYPFLKLPRQSFLYCSECKKLVPNKRRHHVGNQSHSKYCHQEKEGFTVLSWEMNNPPIIEYPVNYENGPFLCSVYKECYQMAQNTAMVPETSHTLLINHIEQRDCQLFRSILQRRNTHSGLAAHLQHCHELSIDSL